MHFRILAAGIFFFFLAGISGVIPEESSFPSGGSIGIQDVVKRVLEHGSSVSVSREESTLALNRYRRSLAGTFPQCDLAFDYSLSTNWGMPGEGLTSTDFPHSLSTHFTVSQLLPTSGTLKLQLGNVMYVNTAGSEAEAAFIQNPRAAFVLEQPLFLNGKVIDMELYRATARRSEIDYLRVGSKYSHLKNKAIYDALHFFFRAIALRKDIALIARKIVFQEEKLIDLQQKYNRGLISEIYLLDTKTALLNQKGIFLEIRDSLITAELSLGLMLGMEKMTNVVLDENLLQLEAEMDKDEITEGAMISNPFIYQERLMVKEKELERIIAGRENSSLLNLSFSLEPQYPEEGENHTLFGSFSELFSKDAYLNCAFSIGLNIPFYCGGKKKYQREISLAPERIARENLLSGQRSVHHNLEVLFQRMRNLEEKAEFLRDSIQLGKTKIEYEKRQCEIGESTHFELQNVEFDLEARSNELWVARADLILVILDVYMSAGKDLESLIEELVK
jgi:outer membrane protein TolC